MRLLYAPLPNLVVRSALRPVARLVPERYQFPVTGQVRVRPPGGRPFTLACNPTSYLAKTVFWGGTAAFEPELLPVFRHLARGAATFVDVGANIGYYTLLAAAYNPRVEAVAFEPSPGPFAYLERNLAANALARATAQRVALGDQPGQVTFYACRNPKYPNAAQLGGTGSADADQAARHGAADRIEVEADTLDARVRRHLSGPVDLLKVDVEGGEGAVLRGAEIVLSEDRPVVVFESLPGGDGADVAGLLARHRYAIYLATDGGLVAAAPGEPDASPSAARWTNYVGVPEERCDRLASLMAGTPGAP